jgi:uncharacterized protein YraI
LKKGEKMKKLIFPMIFVLVILLSACQTATETPTPQTEPMLTPQAAAASVTSTTYLNVRSGPSTNYPILFTAAPNTSGEAVGISPDGGWYAVKVPVETSGNEIGWVSGDYVTTQNVEGLPALQPPPPPPTVQPPPPPSGSVTGVTTEPVNVRSGPSSQYPSYGTIPLGTTVTITGVSQDGSWYQVVVPSDVSPDGTGWISGRYLTLSDGTVPTQPGPSQPPSVEPSPPQSGAPVATAIDAANVRSGPSNQYSSYGVVARGDSAQAIGQSSDGGWVAVALPTSIAANGQGWIVAYSVSIEPSGAQLPVLEP